MGGTCMKTLRGCQRTAPSHLTPPIHSSPKTAEQSTTSLPSPSPTSKAAHLSISPESRLSSTLDRNNTTNLLPLCPFVQLIQETKIRKCNIDTNDARGPRTIHRSSATVGFSFMGVMTSRVFAARTNGRRRELFLFFSMSLSSITRNWFLDSFQWGLLASTG